MPISQTPSLREIVDYFQGPNDLASYVRGGAYVPDIAANSAISTTVAGLSLAQFKGADKATTTPSVPTGRTIGVYAVGNEFYDAWGEVRFGTNGNIYTSDVNNGDVVNGAWLTNGTASNYQIMVSAMTSGLTSNASGAWTTASTDIRITTPNVSSGQRSYTATVQIRQVGQTAVLATYQLEFSLQGQGGGVIS